MESIALSFSEATSKRSIIHWVLMLVWLCGLWGVAGMCAKTAFANAMSDGQMCRPLSPYRTNPVDYEGQFLAPRPAGEPGSEFIIAVLLTGVWVATAWSYLAFVVLCAFHDLGLSEDAFNVKTDEKCWVKVVKVRGWMWNVWASVRRGWGRWISRPPLRHPGPHQMQYR